MSEKECPTCGRTDFTSKRGMRRHHSIAHGESLVNVDVVCDNCGEHFQKNEHQVNKNQNNYCSTECESENKSNKVEVECDECGKKVEKKPYYVERADNNFCSKECYMDYRNTTEIDCLNCGKTTTKPQCRVDEYEKNFCSNECYYEYIGTGEFVSPVWRKKVLERDNMTCQDCGSTSNLHAHHIKKRETHPELAYDVDNGITVCVECHAKRHKEKGEEKISKLLLSHLD